MWIDPPLRARPDPFPGLESGSILAANIDESDMIHEESTVPRLVRSLVLAAVVVSLTAWGCDGGEGTLAPGDDPANGSAVIGSEGGTVSLGVGARVTVPSGALSSNTRVTIDAVATPSDLSAEGARGQAYRIEPADLVLAVPVRISIFLPATELEGVPASAVTLLRSSGAEGALVPAGEELAEIALSGGIVSGNTNRFGTFAAAVNVGPNRPPVVDAGPDREVTVGDRATVSASADDPDGDDVAFSWSVVGPDGAAVPVDGADGASASFVADSEGVFTATVTASDGLGGTATASVRIIARASGANLAPTADAGPDGNGTVGEDVLLDGSGSTDPDGDPLDFAWRQISGPDVVITDASSAIASFAPSEAGTYVFELTVTDGQLASTDQVTVVVVQPNRAPVVELTGLEVVFTGSQVTVESVSTDPDGDPLTHEWSIQSPAGSLPFTEGPNGRSITFVADPVGAIFVSVSVSDGSLEEDGTFTVISNLDVAGTFPATTFVATFASDGCQGLVPTGEPAEGDLVVEQPDPSTVTLLLSDLSDFIASDPTGVLTGDFFNYSGPITITDGTTLVDATGSITGTFSGDGGVDLAFSFSVFSCLVEGTITRP